MHPFQVFDLQGRVAVITGAASGIGEATAKTLAAAGAGVVLGDIDVESLHDVVREIEIAGGRGVGQSADVRRRGDLDELVERAMAEHGRLDIMCNVAGIGSYGPLAEASEAELARTFGVNVNGVLFGCQAALKVMIPSRRGSIVNVSATAIDTPVAGVGLYAASKAAVAMLTQTLAVESGVHGIRVNAVAPGFTLTNFVGGHLRDEHGRRDPVAFEQYLEVMRDSSPLGILGEASDQANLIWYLASDASRFVTGAVMRANGGQSMGR